MKDGKSFPVERDSDRYLISNVKTVNHISEHGLIATMYEKDSATLIEMQISVIQITDILPNHNWKALEKCHPMTSYMGIFWVPTGMNTIRSRVSLTF